MMSRRAAALALVVMAGACGDRKDSAPASGSAAGAAAPGGAAPGGNAATTVVPIAPSEPDPFAETGSAAEASCDDDDIRRRIEAGLGQSAAYLAALDKRTARWKKDCEAARRDLLALEPDATKFVSSMIEFATWGKSLSAACRTRVEQLGEQSSITADLEKRTPVIEQRVRPMLERCKDHPGFADAAAKGLRLLRKKPQ
jgi:hypothetical protein